MTQLTKKQIKELKSEQRSLIAEIKSSYRIFQFMTEQQQEKYVKAANRIIEIDAILEDAKNANAD